MGFLFEKRERECNKVDNNNVSVPIGKTPLHLTLTLRINWIIVFFALDCHSRNLITMEKWEKKQFFPSLLIACAYQMHANEAPCRDQIAKYG